MRFREIQPKIKKAIIKLHEEDGSLIKRSLDEQAISHQLAVKLLRHFPELAVDCEYNGNSVAEHHRKIIKIENSKLARLNKSKYRINSPDSEMIPIPVTPDIIIHERLTNTKNTLIIEVKKSTNLSRKAFDLDKEKLSACTMPTHSIGKNEFRFSFGLLLVICCSDSCDADKLIWFKNGAIIKEDILPIK